MMFAACFLAMAARINVYFLLCPLHLIPNQILSIGYPPVFLEYKLTSLE